MDSSKSLHVSPSEFAHPTRNTKKDPPFVLIGASLMSCTMSQTLPLFQSTPISVPSRVVILIGNPAF